MAAIKPTIFIATAKAPLTLSLTKQGEVPDAIALPFGEQITLLREDQHPAIIAGLAVPASSNGYVQPNYAGNTRGYTGHEQLDNGLIHMNGRVYDPSLGRFLSADPLVQAPNNTQSHNRYAYAVNNPLKYTDPSGYSWLSDLVDSIGDFLKKYGRVIVAIAITVATGGAAAPLWQVMLGGFAAGMVASGGDLKAGLIGAVSAGLFYGIGSYYEKAANAKAGVFQGTLSAAEKVEKAILHGIVGGAQTATQGGKFVHGFFSTGLTQGSSRLVGQLGGRTERVLAAAVLGGAVSEVTGGKFANGAVTGAFSRAFNDEAHKSRLEKAKDFLAGALKGGSSVLRGSTERFGRAFARNTGLMGSEEFQQAYAEGHLIDDSIEALMSVPAEQRQQLISLGGDAVGRLYDTNPSYYGGRAFGRIATSVMLAPLGFFATLGDVSHYVETGATSVEQIVPGLIYGGH